MDKQTQKEAYLLSSYYVLGSRFILSDTYYIVRSLSQLRKLRYFHSHIPKEEITAVISTADIYTAVTAYQAKHTFDPQYSPQWEYHCDPCVMEGKTNKTGGAGRGGW